MRDRRLKIREKLNPIYRVYYDVLCSSLGEEWQPFSGLRTEDDQKKLYARGRTSPGNIVTYAEPWFSPHNYGCATDWIIFDSSGSPIWISTKDRKWEEYEMACAKAGAMWGGFFKRFKDYPHNELPLKVSWRYIGKVYYDNGLDKAIDEIKKNLEGGNYG